MKEKDKDKEDLSDMVAEHTARQNVRVEIFFARAARRDPPSMRAFA